MSYEFLYLSQEDVLKAGGLDMSIAVPTMEEVFKAHARKDCVLPDKSVLRWGDMNSELVRGRINCMPGYIGGDIQLAGIKWIGSAPLNPSRYNLPRASALIILNDPETLLPIAVMEGAVISAVRTGANSGVAAKYLAKKDSRVLALIGAGVINRTQMLAICHAVPSIQEVRVYDIDSSRTAAFVADMKTKLDRRYVPCSSAREAVAGADVFVTATVAAEPIILEDMVEDGIFYSHIGGHECEYSALLKMDKLVVDDWEQLKHRGTESLVMLYQEGKISDASIYATIGQLALGEKQGRENDREKIYMCTVGMGIQDIALGKRIMERAQQMGLGQKIKLYDSPFAV